jgi:hypothetical protein
MTHAEWKKELIRLKYAATRADTAVKKSKLNLAGKLELVNLRKIANEKVAQHKLDYFELMADDQ